MVLTVMPGSRGSEEAAKNRNFKHRHPATKPKFNSLCRPLRSPSVVLRRMEARRRECLDYYMYNTV